jgi:DNA-binding NtrC family response regulator
LYTGIDTRSARHWLRKFLFFALLFLWFLPIEITGTQTMIRLLLYSRHPQLHSLLASNLGDDFSLAIDSSRERVTDLVLQKKCDVVVLDLDCCPADDPFGLIDKLQSLDVPLVIVTGDASRKTAIELLGRGVQNYCRKPVAVQELSLAVRWAHEHAVLKRELADHPPQSAPASGCGQLIGSSAGSQEVYDLIRRVADLNAFVLITGESGTGKELIARAIHSLGARKQKPFVAVSCGAIPDSLIEAELFGCEKGAFTGASARRTGYFEEAADGTLLLDEIGELSHHTQVKLLRVLQQREFTRLGSSKTIPLSARVLFATNRNLKRMVAEGTFREDLYYRLNVIGIQSLPLRDRPDDIPEIAQHFLAKYARGNRKAGPYFEPDALELLCQHTWPGNVRELENVIQSAIILSDDDAIRASNLPEDLQQTDLKRLNVALRWTSFDDQLHDYKVKLATDAVKECGGNKTLAAQKLNISRTYLHRLIREPGEECSVLRVA